MSKLRIILITALVAAVWASSIYYTRDDDRERNVAPAAKKDSLSEIELAVSKMPLERKVGQMMIVGFEGKYPDEHIKNMIENYGIGGVNLLARNVRDESQVKKMTEELQKMSAIPMFIATDQEGGKVVRFKFLKELARQLDIKSADEAERTASDRAAELKKLGVNMNFSPVLDYVPDSQSYLFDRTFGQNPETAGNFGVSMIKGYLKSGVIPVAKHFPGYGNMKPDPHRNEARLEIDKKVLEINLVPFRKAVNSGQTMAIMTAHIKIPAIDSKPATVSDKFISEILRQEMDFDGVVMTDDMEMVSSGGNIASSSIEAVKAGVDVIIVTHTPSKQKLALNGIINAVRNGEITEKRIDESVVRIFKLKKFLEN